MEKYSWMKQENTGQVLHVSFNLGKSYERLKNNLGNMCDELMKNFEKS